MDPNARFARCMAAVLRQEGGFADLPSDPGGATNFGISTPTLTAWRGHPVSRLDVLNLTQAEAETIYRADYWNKLLGDLLPAGPDLATFDCGVNQGVSVAARYLQAAVSVTCDGLVGPRTIAAANAANPLDVIDRIAALRVERYRQAPAFGLYGEAWLRRVSEITATAKSFVAPPPPEAAAAAIAA